MTDNVHALIGAYAVDAVTPAERAEFESHLPACEDCRAELPALLETAATLGAAEEIAPSAALRSHVLAQVAVTAQLPPLVDEAPDALAARRTARLDTARLDTAQFDTDQPGTTRPRSGWPRLAVAAATAAVLAVGGLVGSTVAERRGAELALEKDVMMVASAPDAESMDLGLGTAHVVVSEKMQSVVAMGDDCPKPKSGMEYQLWLVMEDGSKQAGPTFTPDADGEFMALAHVDLDGVAAIAITEEPGGGSPMPTSSELAVVEL